MPHSHRGWLVRAILVLELALGAPAWGQVPFGGLRGSVSDAEFGGPAAQAVVQLVELNLKQTTTEDGHFLFEGVPPGTYTVTVSKPGYERRVEPSVIVGGGTLADLAIELKGEFTDMEELMVRDLELTDTASESGLLNLRRSTLSFQDSVSKDMMSRAGAGDAASALKLVVGASVVDGKYATVRGMSDRYVGVALNGMRVPSSDPKKRAVQLDIFPSGTIESMTVSKTFTPDLPGDYSGGGVNIRTISIPEKPFAKFSMSREINGQNTGKDGFVTYEGGGCSQWGRDQGSRAMPAELASMVNNPTLAGSIASGSLPGNYSRHDQLVDADHPQDPVFAEYDKITRSLSPAMGTKSTQVPDGNYGYSLSSGSRKNVGGDWTLGGIGAFTYGNKFSVQDVDERTYALDPPGIETADSAQYRRQTGIQEIKDSMLLSVGLAKGDEQSFGFTWLRTQTATDRASIRNDVRFPYQLGDSGQSDRLQGIQYTERSTDTRQFTWQRKFEAFDVDLFAAQNKVRQYDPDTRRFRELVSHPDSNSWNYIVEQPTSAQAVFNASRIWRDIEEDNTQEGMNLAFPFRTHESEGNFKLGFVKDMTKRTFSQSAFTYVNVSQYQQKPPSDSSNSNAVDWYNHDVNAASFKTTAADPGALWTDSFSNPDNIGGGPYQNEMRWYIKPQLQNNMSYEGAQDIPSGYWMLDYPLTSRLKALCGARLEVTDISVNPYSSFEAVMPGTAPYYTLTNNAGAYLIQQVTRDQAQTHLQEADWLRSMGLVYELAPKMNLRVNWSQTIARPTFRETASVLSVDPIDNENFFGNQNLVVSHIENDDVRWEWFRKPGEVWAVSWFYKKISDPIEKVSFNYFGDPYVVAVNYPEGQVSGMEYEARKDLDFLPGPFEALHVGANYTKMRSLVVLPADYANQLKAYNLYPEERDTAEQYVSPFDQFVKGFAFSFFNMNDLGAAKGATRDMEGQPAFLFNFNLGYDIEKWGTSLNWFYNIRGDMLKTGAAVASAAIPDVYTKKASMVNFGLTQKLNKTVSVTVGAQNLLDQEVREVYRLPDGKEIPKRSYREGIRYTFSISGTW
ncbi:MAG: TonB-dependent receptor [bacterium]